MALWLLRLRERVFECLLLGTGMTLFPDANFDQRTKSKTLFAVDPSAKSRHLFVASVMVLTDRDTTAIQRLSTQRGIAFDAEQIRQQAIPGFSAAIPHQSRPLAGIPAESIRRAAKAASDAERLTNVHESAMRIGHRVKDGVQCQEGVPYCLTNSPDLCCRNRGDWREFTARNLGSRKCCDFSRHWVHPSGSTASALL